MKYKRSCLYRKIVIIFILIIAVNSMILKVSSIDEEPTNVFTGIPDFVSQYQRINYGDMIKSNSFAKRAIYETSALQLFKLQDGSQYRPTRTLSKEEALTAIITAIGQEQEAILATTKLYGSKKL